MRTEGAKTVLRLRPPGAIGRFRFEPGMNEPTTRRLLRFSVFEVDLDSGELFKKGQKVKLQEQPFELLVELLKNAGAVVTREHLKDRLWPGDTAGDFDSGLNRAINRIREVLGDSAESPHFIETLPRRGYRFIGTVSGPDIVEPAPAAPPTERPAPDAFRAGAGEPPPRPRRPFGILLAIAAAVLVAISAVWFVLHRPARKGGLELRQLTANSTEDPIGHPVISPDGRYLAYGDQAGIEIRLISTGESHVLPRPQGISAGDVWFPAAWLPDGTRLLATCITSTTITAWTVSVIGGTATALRDNAFVQSVSPDGSLIAFISNEEIWFMGPNGDTARKVVPNDGINYYRAVRWSPDGKRIAYQKWRGQTSYLEYSIESRDLNGGTPSILLSTRESNSVGTGEYTFPDDFWWLPDGRVIYSINENPLKNRDCSLWQVRVDSRNGKPRATPQIIASLAFHIQGFSLTRDGTKLVGESNTPQSHILVGRLGADGKLAETRRLTHVERFNLPSAWTSDSKSIIFSSDRNGATWLYKQALDQNEPELIAGGGDQTVLARVSPDGAFLIYETQSRSQSVYRLMRVAFPRHAPQLIFENGDRYLNFSCPNRPGTECVGAEDTADGKQCRFISFDPASGQRRELFQLRLACSNWVVSPDASRIAMVGSGPGPIEIRSLTGELLQRIEVKGWPNPFAVDWAADGRSVFVPHSGLIESPSAPIGVTLLRVYLDGRVQPLWATRSDLNTYAVASPDGKYVAISEPASERNAWMIENF